MTPQDQQDAAHASFVMEAISFGMDVSREDIEANSRGSSKAALARQVSIYLTHVAFGISLQRVGKAFGRDRSTAAHACHRIEDRRDDVEFDAFLDEMEASLRSAPKYHS